MTRQRRKFALTFIVAGMGALFAEHLLRPGLKRKLRV